MFRNTFDYFWLFVFRLCQFFWVFKALINQRLLTSRTQTMHYEIGKSLKIIKFDSPKNIQKLGPISWFFPSFHPGGGEKKNFTAEFITGDTLRADEPRALKVRTFEVGWKPRSQRWGLLWETPFFSPKKKTNCPLTFETPKSLIFSQNQVALRLEGVQRKDKHVSRQNSHSHIHFHGFKKSF